MGLKLSLLWRDLIMKLLVSEIKSEKIPNQLKWLTKNSIDE
jgi:hypothetical protein